MKCPKCKSKLKKYHYQNTECYECEKCGFDSCSEYIELPEQRASQKAKGRYSPYKAGRSLKNK